MRSFFSRRASGNVSSTKHALTAVLACISADLVWLGNGGVAAGQTGRSPREAMPAQGAATQTAASCPAMQRRDVPHAGLSLTLEEGFGFQVPSEPFMAAHAIRQVQDKPSQAVSVMVYPVAAEVSAGEFAEAMTAELLKNPAMKATVERMKSSVKMGGLEAQGRVMKYTFRGVPSAAVRLFAVRQVESAGADDKPQPLRLCYMVTIEAPAAGAAGLAKLMSSVTEGFRLIAIRRPIGLAIDAQDCPVADYSLGYSLASPLNWYQRLTPTGVETGLYDYAAGVEMPVARMVVREERMAATAEAVTTEAVQAFKAGVSQAGAAVDVVTSGPATAAGKDGYQVVLRQTAGKALSQPGGDGEGEATYIVQRTILAEAGNPAKRRSYSTRVYCLSKGPQLATEIAEKLAGGMQLLTAPAASASAPAGS